MFYLIFFFQSLTIYSNGFPVFPFSSICRLSCECIVKLFFITSRIFILASISNDHSWNRTSGLTFVVLLKTVGLTSPSRKVHLISYSPRCAVPFVFLNCFWAKTICQLSDYCFGFRTVWRIRSKIRSPLYNTFFHKTDFG